MTTEHDEADCGEAAREYVHVRIHGGTRLSVEACRLVAVNAFREGARWQTGRDAGNAVVLKFGDAFMCTGDHAVGEAYLLSCAEAAIMRKAGDRYEIGHALARYAAGDMTLEEAIAFMNEDLDQEPVE